MRSTAVQMWTSARAGPGAQRALLGLTLVGATLAVAALALREDEPSRLGAPAPAVAVALVTATWVAVEPASPAAVEPAGPSADRPRAEPGRVERPAADEVRAPPGLRVTGRVVDIMGAPVPGAEVEASVWGQRSRAEPAGYGVVSAGRSGPDGQFELAGLPAGKLGPGFGSVRLVARAGDAMAELQQVVVGEGQPAAELVVAPRSTLGLHVEAGPGVVPSISGYHVGGDGDLADRRACDLVVEDCEAGDWFDLGLSAPGFQPRRLIIRMPCEPVTVRLTPATSCPTGRVLRPDGTPAAGVTVSVGWWTDGEELRSPKRPGVEERPFDGGRAEATTGPDGSFALWAIPPGAAGSGWYDLRAPVEDGEPTLVDWGPVTLGAGPLLLIQGERGTCWLRARFVDQFGVPVLGVDHPGYQRDHDAPPDVVRLDARHPGRATLFVKADGCLERTLEVDARTGEVDLGLVQLERGGSIEVTARWPAAPIAFLSLQDVPGTGSSLNDHHPGHLPADPGAPVVFDRVRAGPGTFRLSAHRPDGGRYAATFSASVLVGQVTRVDLDLSQAALLPPETR